jgi:integrase
MLTLYRRHRSKCKMKGRKAKCSCPIWAQGALDGEKIRQSLDLTNWEAAQKRIRDWEVDGKKNVISLGAAYDRFIAQHEVNGHAKPTVGKHKLLQRRAVAFLGDVPLKTISVDDMARFRESWSGMSNFGHGLGPTTARNEIERLRQFFKFCLEREWIDKNPASALKLPIIKNIERKPYEDYEIQQIDRATGFFPNWGIYGELNRERVKAFIAVLRWTGMRIGDAVLFSKDTVKDGQIILRTQKNGKRVSIPLHADTEAALEKIDKGNHYYFWSGEGTIKSALAAWSRTLKRLSQIAKFKVTAHRFRHTLIVKLLSNGIPISEVAAIAGNSPRIIERHYNQFVQSRQDRINEAVKAIWK